MSEASRRKEKEINRDVPPRKRQIYKIYEISRGRGPSRRKEKEINRDEIPAQRKNLQDFAEAFRYIEEHGYKVIGQHRTCYIDGAWNQKDPEKWLSVIQIPIE